MPVLLLLRLLLLPTFTFFCDNDIGTGVVVIVVVVVVVVDGLLLPLCCVWFVVCCLFSLMLCYVLSVALSQQNAANGASDLHQRRVGGSVDRPYGLCTPPLPSFSP